MFVSLQYWNELKHQAAYKHSSSTYIETDNYKRDSVYLRDKSASCGHGLELTQRPATYPKKFDKTLLISSDSADQKTDTKKRVNFEDRKVIFEEKIQEHLTVSKNETTKISFTEKKRLNDLTSIKEITSSSSSTSEINKCTVFKESLTTSAINLNCASLVKGLEKSISENSLSLLAQCEEPIKYIDETVDEMYDRSHMNVEWKNEIIEELIGSLKKSCLNLAEGVGNNTTPANSPEKNLTDKSLDMLQTASIKVDNIELKPTMSTTVRPTTLPRSQISDTKVIKKPPEIPAKPDILKKPAVPPRSFTTRITRGRLDKSHSTPAYDTTQETVDIEISRTPEILITAPEVSEAANTKQETNNEVRFNTWEKTSTSNKEIVQKEYETKVTTIETTSVVETVNPVFSDIRQMTDTPPEPPPRTVYGESPGKIKHFEPKSISTPINKTPMMDFPTVDTHKTVAEVSKSSSESKVSPTNSVVRAMMSKNKSGKKKNSLIASM